MSSVLRRPPQKALDWSEGMRRGRRGRAGGGKVEGQSRQKCPSQGPPKRPPHADACTRKVDVTWAWPAQGT